MSFALSDRHRPISVGEERDRLRAASAQAIGKMSLNEEEDASARSGEGLPEEEL